MAAIPADKRVMWTHHAVRKGETLSIIAQKYGSTVKDLAQANSLDVKKPISIGQSLLIPIGGGIVPPQASGSTPSTARASGKPASYTVRKGDNLNRIAAQFGVSVADLQRWNRLTSTNIAAGQTLVVGEPASVASKPASAADNTRKVVHKVRTGETLGRIAQTYKTTVEAIRSWNGRNDLSIIHPGDQITIFVGN
jgi:membrane-bound lytic murein transglycosylase D